jgi:hypothetical protein
MATETSPLLKSPPLPTAYTYLPDEDDGREVEVWKPGKSTFSQTVSLDGRVLGRETADETVVSAASV